MLFQPVPYKKKAPIPSQIQILKDSETTRCLGAYIGNMKEGCEPWPKIIEDIENSLHFWDKGYPGLKGRKHIIQMVISRKTQFITQAQGMPAEYEKYLTKRIRTYMWGSETTPPIATNLLIKSKEIGGQNILDLQAHNEAINIMKLQKLLDYSPDCPTASDATLAIIIAAIPKTPSDRYLEDNSISDIFLQSIYKRQRYSSRSILK